MAAVTVFPYETGPQAPVRAGEVICGQFVPFTLAPGVALRAAPCLVCRKPVGGASVVVHTFLGFEGPACPCGNVTPIAFLRHESCPEYNDQLLTDLAIATLRHHHPAEMGSDC